MKVPNLSVDSKTPTESVLFFSCNIYSFDIFYTFDTFDMSDIFDIFYTFDTFDMFDTFDIRYFI